LNVSPDLISTITDEVLSEVEQWQQRPLEPMYPIVYFDALRLKIRDEGTVRNKAVYLALGIKADGKKEVLGLWIEQTEGAKFWLKVFNESWSGRCTDCRRGRPAGLPGSDRSRLSSGPNPDLHRAPDPQFAQPGQLEGSQVSGCRT
jgi:transposase-like protein